MSSKQKIIIAVLGFIICLTIGLAMYSTSLSKKDISLNTLNSNKEYASEKSDDKKVKTISPIQNSSFTEEIQDIYSPDRYKSYIITPNSLKERYNSSSINEYKLPNYLASKYDEYKILDEVSTLTGAKLLVRASELDPEKNTYKKSDLYTLILDRLELSAKKIYEFENFAEDNNYSFNPVLDARFSNNDIYISSSNGLSLYNYANQEVEVIEQLDTQSQDQWGPFINIEAANDEIILYTIYKTSGIGANFTERVAAYDKNTKKTYEQNIDFDSGPAAGISLERLIGSSHALIKYYRFDNGEEINRYEIINLKEDDVISIN